MSKAKRLNNDDVKPEVVGLRNRISAMQAPELIKYMQDHHKSDVYLLIRDHMEDKQIRALETDKEFGGIFKAIRREAMQSYTHDNTAAKNIDVDKAVSQAYIILLRMIKVLSDDLTDIKIAINRIEERCDMEMTTWSDTRQPEQSPQDGDTDGQSVQAE